MRRDFFKNLGALILTSVIAATTVVGQFDGAITAKAAEETNISMVTATEIANDSFQTGSLTKDDGSVGRWFKFKNYTDSCVVAELTMTRTAGDAWPDYNCFYSNGKSTGNAGDFWQDGETTILGMEANETVYVHITHYTNCSFTVHVKMTPEEANSLKTVKKTIKSGKNISGSIEYEKDVDVFKIKAKKTGTMTVKITNNNLGNDLSYLKYTVYNKSKRAKANGSISYGKTQKVKIKVKKGQTFYVQLEGDFHVANRLNGTYVVGTKIK